MQLTAENMAILRIARSGGVGPVTFKKIVNKAGSALAAIDRWKNLVGDKPLYGTDDAMRELESLDKNGGWIALLGDNDYPAALSHIADAPPVLCGLGDKSWLAARQVAVVGNRNASAAGLAWTRQLTADLAARGVIVTSGLARGIDSAAHRGALDAHGGTVAVVGSGPDHIYPPENAKLREEIISRGCLVSEHAWGVTPLPSYFARRNRIIAGLSVGVVISEAARESASLMTARCALDYGREVWAVPGSPADPRAGGPNWLLKQGATLIENAADVMASLPAEASRMRRQGQLLLVDVDDAQVVEEDTAPLPADGLLALLGQSGVSVDELVRQSGKTEAALMAELVELEMLGNAVCDPDGGWRRT